MNLLEAFENGTGTYLKVVRFAQPTNPDGVIALYLRPDSRFLLLGYWRHYEHSYASGTWVRQGGEIHLEGRGHLATDSSICAPDNGRFRRGFLMETVVCSPSLVASEELKGWSLLGWRGTYAYAGQNTIIDSDGQWLPTSLTAVDKWISEKLKC